MYLGMKDTVSSLDEIFEAMPLVQQAVRLEIAARIESGDKILHADGISVMRNDVALKPVDDFESQPAKDIDRDTAQIRAA
jgi:hypothetical protein